MRSFVLPFAASAVFAITVLSCSAVSAERAVEPPVICAALTVAAPAKLIESCTALIDNPGKYDRAIEDYNEALRLKPDFAEAFSDRGAAWYFKGEYQKAIADYDEAIRLEPNRAQTYSNRGSAYRKLGRTVRALDDDTSAIRIDPSQPEFFDNRGLHLAGNVHYKQAVPDYNEAIQIRPG